MQIFENYKDHLRRALLVFVIFSIGFACGKHSVLNKATVPVQEKAIVPAAPTGENLVRLYYMHAMFRCVTCNSIEEMAKKLTKTEFSSEIAARQIEWVEVNFQEDRTLAEKFDVVASCIVVAVVKNGQIIEFSRLDEVWTLLEKPEEFNAYIRDAIKKALKNFGSN